MGRGAKKWRPETTPMRLSTLLHLLNRSHHWLGSMAPASKGASEADIVFNRVNVQLANLKNTLASFLPPPTETSNSTAKAVDKDDEDLWQPVPDESVHELSNKPRAGRELNRNQIWYWCRPTQRYGEERNIFLSRRDPETNTGKENWAGVKERIIWSV